MKRNGLSCTLSLNVLLLAATSVAQEAPPETPAAASPGAPVEADAADPGGSEAEAPPTTPESVPEADSPAVSAPPEGKIHLVAEAPELDNTRTYHRHDGFYLRVNFGYGSTWGSFDDSGPGNIDVDLSGSGLGFDVLAGGSPSPGFVIGGGLVVNQLFSADLEPVAGARSAHDVQSGLVGVFVDGFPKPNAGWHLGGLVGLASVTVKDGGGAEKTGGLGGAIWGGYDAWVGDEWSLGALLRFTATRTTGGEAPLDVAASHGNLALMLTALYH